LRDYLYVPLGGNRGSRARTLANLMITMVLGGVWHGADGRFLVWGLAHGAGLGATRVWWWWRGRAKHPSTLAVVVSTLATFVLVVQMRIVFRARTVDDAWTVFLAQTRHWEDLSAPLLSLPVCLTLATAIIGHLVPHRAWERLAGAFARAPIPVKVAILVISALFIQHVSSAESQPFIYSRF
jgi:hypothetical protein